MRRLAPSLLVALSVASCRHLPAAPDRIESLARTADPVRVALRIPALSIAVVRDGKVVLARGLGLADVDPRLLFCGL